MIEATRRRSPAPTGSVMRRLMTRQIQSHLAGATQYRPVPVETPPPAAQEAPSAQQEEEEMDSADLAQLRLEVAVMKAALAAERRESETLKASLGLAEPESLSEEARAVRERWAALVERLIHTPL